MTFKVEKEGKISFCSLQEFETLTGSKFSPKLSIDSVLLPKIKKMMGKYRLKGELTRRQLWLGAYYEKEIETCFIPSVVFRWIDDEMGWGVFADTDFKKGDFISEYGGVLRKRKKEDKRNSYCFQYSVTDEIFTKYNIDAREQGGVARFINHSYNPNLTPTIVTYNEVTHIILIANGPIKKGSQLLYDYGPDYWSSRKGLKRIES